MVRVSGRDRVRSAVSGKKVKYCAVDSVRIGFKFCCGLFCLQKGGQKQFHVKSVAVAFGQAQAQRIPVLFFYNFGFYGYRRCRIRRYEKL